LPAGVDREPPTVTTTLLARYYVGMPAEDGLLNALAEPFSERAHDHELGSMTRRLVEAVARELSALADQLRAFYGSAFIETAAPRRWLLPLLPAAVVVAVAITWRRCKPRERDWRNWHSRVPRHMP
jgi:hypothetical protein